MSGGIIFTMFQVPMSLHMASSICKNFYAHSANHNGPFTLF
jgi:hypothetical protein